MPHLTICPYCGAEARDPWDEIAHMEATHPEVIAERLRAAGFEQVGDRWVDRYSAASAPVKAWEARYSGDGDFTDGAEARDPWDEIAHMEATHPEVIAAAALRAAGFEQVGDRWVDRYSAASAPGAAESRSYLSPSRCRPRRRPPGWWCFALACVLAAAAVCVLSLIRGQPLVFLSDLTLLAAWWRLLSGSWSRPMPQISIPLVALAFGFWLTGVMT